MARYGADLLQVLVELGALLVDVLRLETLSTQLSVRSQGTVLPRTQTTLGAEVAGTIVEISPKFIPGGVFRAGEVLLRIDATDYRVAVRQADALVKQRKIEFDGAAKLRQQGYRAEAEYASAAAALVAREDVRSLRFVDETTLELVTDQPEITYRELPLAPSFRADFADWNFDPSPSPDKFRFDPPDGAIQVDAGGLVQTLVNRFARVLFEVRASNADAFLGAFLVGDEKFAMLDDRQFVLADLVSLRQVGIEVVLAREHRTRRERRIDRQPEFAGHAHDLFVQHRQHAGKTQVDDAGLGVGVGPVGSCRARKNL